VAPLPEDRASGESEEAKEAKEESEEMERERKRIEADARMRRVFRVSEEQNVAAPFPMLIKKKERIEKPAPLDLMEGIRQVKVSVEAQASKLFVLFCF
jgi:tellurite resistance protein